jgi:hypothetical protein
MATRTAVIQSDRNDQKYVATWSGLLQSSSDVGSAVGVPLCDILTFQLSGTLGTGGVITLQGTNDGSNWGTLHTPSGADATLDAIGEFCTVVETPISVRPNVTAGNGSTNLTVIMVAQKRGL